MYRRASVGLACLVCFVVSGLVTPAASLGGYMDYVKDLGPSGYYRLDETGTGPIYDSSGNDRDGAYVASGPSFNQTPGALAPHDLNAAVGGTNWLGSLNTSVFTYGANPFSLSLWIKPDGFTDWGTPLSYGTVDGGKAFLLCESNTDANVGAEQGQIVIGNWGGFYLRHSVNKLNDGEWNHVGVTYDGTTLKLYMNGDLDSSVVTAMTVASWGAELGCPVGGGWGGFRGQTDELAYFHRALGAAEMENLANIAIPEPSVLVLVATGLIGLVAYVWRRRN